MNLNTLILLYSWIPILIAALIKMKLYNTVICYLKKHDPKKLEDVSPEIDGKRSLNFIAYKLFLYGKYSTNLTDKEFQTILKQATLVEIITDSLFTVFILLLLFECFA